MGLTSLINFTIFPIQDTKGDVECYMNYKLIKSFPEMKKTVKESSSQVIDTRMDFHFSGNVPEPNDCKKIKKMFSYIFKRVSGQKKIIFNTLQEEHRSTKKVNEKIIWVQSKFCPKHD